MKKFNYWPVIGTLVVTGLYLLASNYFLPVKNEGSYSSFDHGNSGELLEQCNKLEKGMYIESVGSALNSHNRRSLVSDEKGKKAIFWVSNGEVGAYYPAGSACVVEMDSVGRVTSWKVEDYE